MFSTLTRLRILLGLYLLGALVYFGRVDVNIVYGGDTWGYYGYLPSIFIYGDIQNPAETYLARFEYTNETPRLPEKQGEFTPAENGNNAIKYTSGVAMLQLPFFLIAHGLAAILPEVPSDGYSAPYRWAINLSVLFYFLLGIGWLFKVLTSQFSERTAAWTIVLLTLGSNLFNFLVFRGPMAHGYLFSLYALLLFSTHGYFEVLTKSQRDESWRYALGIGLSAGLITLIRPVEIICLSIPLLYGLSNWSSIGKRLQLLFANYRSLLVAVAVYASVGFIHLAYWKYVTGEWLFFSYGEEQFYWAKSKIHAGLFDYKNGWLRYSPLLFLALAGIPLLWRDRRWLWPVLVFLPLHIYITYAWWNWYYINGFGSRPMVETYALLALPFASFLTLAWQRTWSRVLLIGFAAGCVLLNMFQHEQHQRGVLWTEEANGPYYWSVFGKLSTNYRTLVSFVSDTPQPKEPEQLGKGRLLYQNRFERPEEDSLVQANLVAEGSFALAVPPERRFYEFLGGRLGDFLDLQSIQGTQEQPGWISVHFRARKEVIEAPWYTAPAIVVEGSWKGGWRAVRIDPLLGNPSNNTFYSGTPGEWDEIRFFYPLPDHIKAEDQLKIYLMNAGQTTYIDDVRIRVYPR